jgi:hypothetical protein
MSLQRLYEGASRANGCRRHRAADAHPQLTGATNPDFREAVQRCPSANDDEPSVPENLVRLPKVVGDSIEIVGTGAHEEVGTRSVGKIDEAPS